jgi:hypothetical protein
MPLQQSFYSTNINLCSRSSSLLKANCYFFYLRKYILGRSRVPLDCKNCCHYIQHSLCVLRPQTLADVLGSLDKRDTIVETGMLTNDDFLMQQQPLFPIFRNTRVFVLNIFLTERLYTYVCPESVQGDQMSL